MSQNLAKSIVSQSRRLLEAAIRSPSGDNCQPWSFRFDGEYRIVVTTLPERAKSFFDYQQRGTLLSLGAVIENIRTQAAGDGFRVEVDYEKNQLEDGHTVSINLHEDPSISATEARVNAMLSRTVNRRPYLPVRTQEHKLASLCMDSIEGPTVKIINTFRELWNWARIVYLADRIRYSHPVIHRELFAKIQFTKEMANRNRIGLEIDRLGAGPAARWIMQLLAPWERMRRLSRLGVARMLAGHTRFLCLASGSLILITIEDPSPRGWIRAGEQMERLWVCAEEIGLCVHPVTVALYLDQRYQHEGMANFLPEHEELLKQMHRALKKLLQGSTGAILFRVGMGLRMKDTAVRLPVEDFIATTD